jgi:four helix bundle protein
MDKRPDLRPRARKFALSCFNLAKTIPKTLENRDFIRQLLRASSSVSFNYRAARRARSRAEFIAKLGTVVEEADETVGWLEFLRDGRIAHDPAVLAEAKELCAIFTTALHTARRNRRDGAR